MMIYYHTTFGFYIDVLGLDYVPLRIVLRIKAIKIKPNIKKGKQLLKKK